MIGCVAETIEALERRIDELRVAVREAVLAGDPALASGRRAELRRAQQAWEGGVRARPRGAEGRPGPRDAVARALRLAAAAARAGLRGAQPASRPGRAQA